MYTAGVAITGIGTVTGVADIDVLGNGATLVAASSLICTTGIVTGAVGRGSVADRGVGIITGDSSGELAVGVPIRETNGEVDRLLGEGMVGKSVKSESSCRLYGFWLLYASSSRNVEGVMIL
jgi:hypothetical protein